MRNRILMGAFEEMNAQGVHFTMADLAQKLAISKSTIYKFFPSKDVLIKEILEAIVEDIRQQEEMIAKDPGMSFHKKVEGILAVFPKKFGPISERFIDEVGRFLPQESKAELIINEKWLILETLIKEGIDEGSLRPINLAVLQRMFMLVGNGLVDVKFLTQNKLSAQEAVAASADIIAFGLMHQKIDS